jgi:hypothetical protein
MLQPPLLNEVGVARHQRMKVVPREPRMMLALRPSLIGGCRAFLFLYVIHSNFQEEHYSWQTAPNAKPKLLYRVSW